MISHFAIVVRIVLVFGVIDPPPWRPAGARNRSPYHCILTFYCRHSLVHSRVLGCIHVLGDPHDLTTSWARLSKTTVIITAKLNDVSCDISNGHRDSRRYLL
eukprot:2171970-Amphidinium_carterae.2